MKIRTVTVQMGATTTKDFNAVRNDVGFTADLDEGDDANEIVQQLQFKCRDLLLRSVKRGETPAEKRA